MKIDPGLHYIDENGELRAAEVVIEPTPGGAVLRKTGIKVIFSTDINSDGAIEIHTPDNLRLRGTPVGISYYDPISGNSVMIGELRSSNGKIVGDNQVVYENCFDDVRADAVYEVTKAGVMQTIVIRENIAGPEEYGLSAESRLEVITEFLEAPQPVRVGSVLKSERDPQKRQLMAEPDFIDQTLHFGQCVMPAGVAFATRQGSPKYRVGKYWQDMPGEGRSVLFEGVEYGALKEDLIVLGRKQARVEREAVPGRQLPIRRLAKAKQEAIQMARAAYKPSGVAIDYQVVTSLSTVDFVAGTTYLVENSVTIGTAYFQGGAVLKYARNKALNISSGVNFLGTSANPTIFTGYDDPIGESLPGSTGTPTGTYASTAVSFASPSYPVLIKGFELRHAGTGFHLGQNSVSGTHEIRDGRLEKSTVGISLYGTTANLINLYTCELGQLYSLYQGSTPTQSGVTDCSAVTYYEVSRFHMAADASSYWRIEDWASWGYNWYPWLALDGQYSEPIWLPKPDSYQSPNEWLRIDLGVERQIARFMYYPRPYAANGTILQYKLFAPSSSTTDPYYWGNPVAQGSWDWANTGPKTVDFAPKTTRYLILQGISGVGGWVGAGEVRVFAIDPQPQCQLWAPQISLSFNSDHSAVTVSATSNGGVIRYTTDGSDPSVTSSSTPPTLYGPATVKARAFESGCQPSAVATRIIRQTTLPSFSPSGHSPGAYSSGPINIQITTESGSTGMYRVGVSAAWQTVPYGGNVVVNGIDNGVGRVSAYAFQADTLRSAVSESGNFTFRTPISATVQFHAGNDHETATVTASSVAEATIVYTTDGTEPLPGGSTTPPVINAQSAAVKARAFRPGYEAPVLTVQTPPATAGVAFSPTAHNPIQYANAALPVTVTAESGATVKYKRGTSGTWEQTTNGASPAIDGIGSGSGTIQAYAFTPTKFKGATTTSGEFYFRVPQPTHTISYSGGTATVTFNTLPNASIDLYFNGSGTVSQTLTANGSGVATRSFTTATTVKAKARKSGDIDSGLTTAHVNKLWTPKIANAAGLLFGDITVNGPTEVWLIPNFGFSNVYGEEQNISGWTGGIYFTNDAPNADHRGAFAALSSTTLGSVPPVNVSYGRTYSMAGWYKAVVSGTRDYGGLINYDESGVFISADDVYAGFGASYLTQPLANGGTTAYLSDEQIFAPIASSWYYNLFVPLTNFDKNSPVLFGNQPNQLRDLYQQTILNEATSILVTGINSLTKSVTLSPPYSGANLPVGTAIAHRSAGGTYQYSLLGANLTPTTWTRYTSTFSTMRAGTESVRVHALISRDGGQSAVTGLEFWEGTQADRPKLYYSLNGTEFEASGPVKLPISASTTVSVRQKGKYYFDSDAVTRTITFKVAAPEVSAVADLAGQNVTVTATCATAGATIWYTTNGSEPSPSNGTQYTVGQTVSVAATVTSKWKAFKANYLPSQTIAQLARPEFSPAPGSHAAPLNVTITASAGAGVQVFEPGITLLNSSTWVLGSQSQPGFSANQNVAGENTIEERETPYGKKDKVWVGHNSDTFSGEPGADGGWNAAVTGIDATKLYRFSVWMRKIDLTPTSSSGSSYLGVGANTVSALTGANGDVVQGNPYFWATTQVPLNEWFLIVGFVHPAGYTGTISHGRVYNTAGEAISNGTDFRWLPTTTSTLHRTYLYYCTEEGIKQEFWNPRVEVVSSVTDPLNILFPKGNLLKPSAWVVGGGAQPSWPANGQAGENAVEMRETPFGTKEKVWVATNLDSPPNGGDSDGGWAPVTFPVDRTKTYRFSVWIRKSSATSASSAGRSYLGVQGSTVRNILRTWEDEANPYFWHGFPPLNEWHLVVGYVHPEAYSGTVSQGGVYTSTRQKIFNGTDFRWRATTTTSGHRSYLYYCNEIGAQQEFWNPRVEMVSSANESLDPLFGPLGAPNQVTVNGIHGIKTIEARSIAAGAAGSVAWMEKFVGYQSSASGISGPVGLQIFTPLE